MSQHVQFRSRSMWEQAAAAAGMRISTVEPLHTWLGRPANIPVWRFPPDGIRGPVEYLRDARVPPERAASAVGCADQGHVDGKPPGLICLVALVRRAPATFRLWP